jgi:MFS family permease
MVLILIQSNPYIALSINLFMGALITCYIGPAIAILHSQFDPRMRATVSATFYLIINVIGLGVGPTLIGAISDYLTPTFGNEALRYALLIVIPAAGIWSTFHFILASKRMETG